MSNRKLVSIKSNKGFLKGFLTLAVIVILIVIIVVFVKNLFTSGNVSTASSTAQTEIVNEYKDLSYKNIKVTTQVICENQTYGFVALDVCINADNAFGEHEEINEIALIQIEDNYAEVISEDEYPKGSRDYYINEYKKAFEAKFSKLN